MTHLSQHELDDLIKDVQTVDMGGRPSQKLYPLLRRLIEEMNTLREEQEAREFLANQEQTW